MPDRVLALLTDPTGTPGGGAGHRFVDPDATVVGASDLGVTRGDGVFETVGVRGGRAQALQAHLTRLARSATMLDLPEPDADAWLAATIAVAERLPRDRECTARLVLTRGLEGADRPTGWVLGSPSPDHGPSRSTGIGVAVLDRGVPHDVAAVAPWLLLGAKTLSYAGNLAALREARRRGADDVLFVSSDGFLLEGPTSSLLMKRGDRLITPSTALGILPGTTQADAFRFARGGGLTTSYEVLPRAALDDADGLWLVSSVRGAVPLRTVDEVEHAVDAGFTAELNAFLSARTE